MGTPVATFSEAASIISGVYSWDGTREGCSFFEVISGDSCAYWDIDRRVELPEPVSLEALNVHHRETLALSIAGIKTFLERKYVGQHDLPDEAFLVLRACTAEKSSFHVLLRKRLGGPAERGEFRRKLVRQKAAAERAAATGTAGHRSQAERTEQGERAEGTQNTQEPVYKGIIRSGLAAHSTIWHQDPPGLGTAELGDLAPALVVLAGLSGSGLGVWYLGHWLPDLDSDSTIRTTYLDATLKEDLSYGSKL
ncbi:hypothetical protein CYMTET_18783 [Cymbomonas tetramitiformis]|uniref:Uncharacterized protein n=1 Tax=Cymbomonas tetramitiformis TaxID=36881 RepID=A0AAE0G7X2_9CHLO|nr:hypothetical protein CYMTET_18783 [Cymbomonas tetramitiformis]